MRVVILRFISSPATADDARARDVAQDEAAVVGRVQVAGRGGRLVRPGEDLRPGTPGASGPAGSGPVGDLDDPVALDDDERVGARDDGVGRSRRRRRRSARSSAGSTSTGTSGRTASWTTTMSSGSASELPEPVRSVLSLRVAPPATTAVGTAVATASTSDLRSRPASPGGRRRRAWSMPAWATARRLLRQDHARRRAARTAWGAPRRTGCRHRPASRMAGCAPR